MAIKPQVFASITGDDNLDITDKSLILYLLGCETKKDTIDDIADDFFCSPTELFLRLQKLEKFGYVKIKVELDRWE